MEDKIIESIENSFKPEEREEVIRQLTSIRLDHVMAHSEFNLLNTRIAVLKLAEGDLDKLIRYVESAKSDFRDVIYWATNS